MEARILKVLVIDDIQDNLTSIKALIKDLFPKAKTLTALTGKLGLEIAAIEDPDVILLDIVMPEMDGFNVCRTLKNDKKLSDIPVVFLTALKADKESRIRALESGAEAFLTKPVDEIELTATIRTMQKIKTANLEKRDEKEHLATLVADRTRELEHELSERVRVQHALSESEERYRNLFETAHEGIWVFDENDFTILANGRMAEMLGYKKDELIGKSISDFIRAEDRAEFNSTQIGRRKGKSEILERCFVRKDRSELWTMVSASPVFDAYGKYNGSFGMITDITDRKRSDELLKSAELRFRLLYEQSPTAYQSLDSEGRILEVNTTWLKEMGYEYTEVIGHLFEEFIVPQQVNLLYERFARFITKGEVHNAEFNCLSKKGQIITYDLEGKIGYDLEGKFKQTHCVLHNITERKQVENTLRESEELYRNLVELLPDGIYKSTEEGTFVDVNPALVRMLGYSSKEELMAIDIKTQLYFEIEDRESVQLQENNAETGIYRMKKKDGSEVWVEDHGWLNFDEKSKILFHEGILRDITERKLLEDAQKIVLEISEIADQSTSIHLFLASVHQKLNTVVRSDNFFVALYDKESDTYTFPYQKDEIDTLIPEKQYNLNNGYIDFVRKQGKTQLITKQSGSELLTTSHIKVIGAVPSIWLGVPIKTDNRDEVIGVIAIHDYHKDEPYTEVEKSILEIIANSIGKFILRVRYIEELKNARKKAEESDRLKSAFLANMSHEIRTPMNGILGFAELLKMPGLSGEQQKEYIEIIKKSGKRMLNIINDIVDISKIESGQMQVLITEMNVNEQLDYLYSFFKPEAANKGIKLRCRHGISTPASDINTDQEKLNAVLTNLVKNAIKYTDSGSIEFGYKITSQQSLSLLEFYISDTGIGIPADRQNAIFDRFIQADIADTRAFQGAGLGLSIAKAYVEMLGGKIWVESEEGKGSTFYFTIPYNPVKKTEPAEPIFTTKEKTADHDKKLKVLIVEDDEISVMLLMVMLKEFSTEILVTDTGKEAIEICRNNPDIDLILMDIKMPVMDGYEATRQIRQFDNNVVIIAQTAYGLSGDEEKAIAAGCNDYIAKPLFIALLKRLIQKHFN